MITNITERIIRKNEINFFIGSLYWVLYRKRTLKPESFIVDCDYKFNEFYGRNSSAGKLSFSKSNVDKITDIGAF